MRRNRHSSIQLLVMAGLTIVGLACNSEARAACTGATNTCYGTNALVSNTTGYENSAFGYGALSKSTTGYQNAASGTYALMSNTTGGSNTASGAYALMLNATGYQNTASGLAALQLNTTGSYNTASGVFALGRLESGTYNTATGGYALDNMTSGSSNSAYGSHAMYSTTTGQLNTAVGMSALYFATTGVRNVALGYQAGYAIKTGSDNIIIGGDNQGTSGDSGVIRIGNKTYQKKAFIAGIRGVTTGSTTASTVFIDVNGQLGTIKSSRRFKEDIQPMGSVSDRLFALRPVTFRYKQPYDDGSKPVQYGLIAEEVAEVFSELVVYGDDGQVETVRYDLLATLLLNEVQKDHRVIQAQAARTKALEQQVQTQAEQLAALRRDNEAQVARMAALEQQVAVLARAFERGEKDRLVASAR